MATATAVHGARARVEYATVGYTHLRFRLAALVTLSVIGAASAMLWSWSGGFVVAAMAATLSIDGAWRVKTRRLEPTATILLDAHGLAMLILVTNVPLIAGAAPLTAVVVSAALFLPGRRAMAITAYAAAINGAALLTAPRLGIERWTADQATLISVVVVGGFLLMVLGILFGTGRVMSERDRLDMELRLSEERFRSLADSAPIGVIQLDVEGNCIYANPQLLEMAGVEQSDSAGKGLVELIHEFDRPRSDRAWQTVSTTGQPVETRMRLMRPDGQVSWVIQHLAPMHSSAGAITGYVGTITDVTTQVAARQHAERFNAILEATTDLVGMTDKTGRFLYLNRAARAFVGFDPATDDQGKSADEIFSPESRQAYLRHVVPQVRGRGAWQGELTLVRHDGTEVPVTFVFLAHNGPDGEVAFYSGIARDVSEARENARRLEELVRSKDEFIASVSHELRTPLSVVVGLTQELRADLATFGESEIREFVALIADQASDVADIVEDLLVAARADIGKVAVAPEVIDIHHELDRVLATTKYGGSDRIAICENTATVQADPIRVRQILRNLITNALRYGGEQVEIIIDCDGAETAVQVRDNGAGIPPAERERIFDPYHRAHHRRGQPSSVGLGLTIARTLARLMAGDLVYRYEQGWSVFELSLPSVPAPTAMGDAAEVA